LRFCLYRVLCPRNYGQNGVPHGRRRRGDLPCDEYGYSPPISEISPLLLRGHSMVGTHTHTHTHTPTHTHTHTPTHAHAHTHTHTHRHTHTHTHTQTNTHIHTTRDTRKRT